MKTFLLFVTLFFFIGLINLNAQIKITSDNKVGVRNTSPTYKIDLKTENNLRIDGLANSYMSGTWIGSDDTYDIVLTNGPQEGSGVTWSYPTLMPTLNMGANLGTISYKWRKIYADYVECRDVYETSDEKMKENIRNIDKSLDKILKLKPVLYNFKRSYFIADSLESKYGKDILIPKSDDIGFLAQDLIQVVPEAVNYDKESDMYAIDYTDLIPLLTKAIQEQQTIISSQDTKITSLEAELAILKSQIDTINKKLNIK